MSSSTIAAYDAARRESATKDRTPSLRTNAPGLAVRTTATVFPAHYSRKDRLLTTVDPASGERQKMRPHDVVALVQDEESPAGVVFADEANLNMLVADARRGAAVDPALGELARVLSVSAAMPAQGRIATLTQALNAKFYAPYVAPRVTFHEWATAFGLSGRSTIDVMNALVDRVSRTDANDGEDVDDRNGLARDLPAYSTAEYHSLESARYGLSGESGARAYRALDRADALWSRIMLADAALLDRNLLTGAVATFDLLASGGNRVSGEVSQPFVVKEGRSVTLSTAAKPTIPVATGTLAGVSVVEGTRLLAIVQVPAKHVGPLARTREPLLIREEPYLSQPVKSQGAQWFGDGSDLPDIPERDVPLEVIVAGAPA